MKKCAEGYLDFYSDNFAWAAIWLGYILVYQDLLEDHAVSDIYQTTMQY